MTTNRRSFFFSPTSHSLDAFFFSFFFYSFLISISEEKRGIGLWSVFKSWVMGKMFDGKIMHATAVFFVVVPNPLTNYKSDSNALMCVCMRIWLNCDNESIDLNVSHVIPCEYRLRPQHNFFFFVDHQIFEFNMLHCPLKTISLNIFIIISALVSINHLNGITF